MEIKSIIILLIAIALLTIIILLIAIAISIWIKYSARKQIEKMAEEKRENRENQ